MTTKSKPQRLALKQVLEMYPACFNLERPRPLKLQIHRDLIAAGYARIDIKHLLLFYCNQAIYRETLIPGAIRVDLQGQPAGPLIPTKPM